MTKEELELLETLLKNFLTYDVTYEVLLTDDVMYALRIVERELKEKRENE